MTDLNEVKDLIVKGNEVTHALRDAVDTKADKATVEAIRADLVATIEAKSKLETQIKAETAAREAVEKRLAEIELEKSRPNFGKKTADVSEGEKAFYDFLGNVDKKSAFEAHAHKMMSTKAIETATGSNGGYAVETVIAAQVAEVAREISSMRRLARVDTTSTPEYSVLVNLGGATARWGNQNVNRTGTASPSLAEVKPVFGTLYADFGSTRQAMQDMVRMGTVSSWAIGEIAKEFADAEAEAFFAGTGIDATGDADQPVGILTGTSIDRVNSGAAAGLGANPFDTIIRLYFGLNSEYQRNGTFVMNATTFSQLVTAKDTTGSYLFPQTLQAGVDGRIFGREVVLDVNMPAVATNSTPILFGDISRAYLIADRTTMFVQENPYRQSGRVFFEAEKRVGGNILDASAAKLLRIAA